MKRTSNGYGVKECTGPCGYTLIVFDVDDKFIGIEHEDIDTKTISIRDASVGKRAVISTVTTEFKMKSK